MISQLLLQTAGAVAIGFSAGALAAGQHQLRSAADYRLHFVDEGASAKLAYGLPASGAVGLMLECAKGSGRVTVSDTARQGARPWLTLAAAGAEPATLRATVLDDGTMIAASPADLPVFERLREGRRISVVSGDVRYGLRPAKTDRPAVERFFTACSDA